MQHLTDSFIMWKTPSFTKIIHQFFIEYKFIVELFQWIYSYPVDFNRIDLP